MRVETGRGSGGGIPLLLECGFQADIRLGAAATSPFMACGAFALLGRRPDLATSLLRLIPALALRTQLGDFQAGLRNFFHLTE